MSHPFLDLPIPIAVGHRGCAGELPENTLASFERGLADGAVILETDLHLTRDGIPVLIHDDDVDRVTEGSGPVRDFDLAALQKLDAGHRFSPDGGRTHPERGRGHRIPTLEEALAAFPGARFNLELKQDLPGLLERTVEIVVEAGREALSLVTAEKDPTMQRLRAFVKSRGARVALGASVGDVVGFVRSALSGEAPETRPAALQIPAEFAGQPLVRPALVDHAHRFGVQIHVWTINEPEQMEHLLDLGVDALISDFPARVVAVADSRRERSGSDATR